MHGGQPLAEEFGGNEGDALGPEGQHAQWLQHPSTEALEEPEQQDRTWCFLLELPSLSFLHLRDFLNWMWVLCV